ncbi:DNA replication and repair protein RecF [Thiohalobacter sp. COW1]|uniref:DNA replication and repair protein RecF n=1 Tax=Thiohalobacter thiocyanaticus TaxID=585455 RepID=A0A1Z4VML6_9GAMM|nr:MULTISPECIES: DNA replication/repair protein RecF [Thiohalobacter]BAZ92598.1 DNA replication and repair protein RecF [Thiohalobacter thiocyanaticus]BCO32425.1 DNA replication and repair protein RecF [Thiohalobacter sp. COW1]
MPLTRLSLSHFRNITAAELELSPRFNLIVGANGSGKTSLLEAIFYLGRVRSFRTRKLDQLIQGGETHFRLIARLADPDTGERTLGIERGPDGQTLRLGGQPVRQLAELARALPIQLLNPDSHLILEGGPRYRRRFLDWGVFHVEPGFYSAWQRYAKALKQRNAALRTGRSRRDIAAWTPALVQAAEVLHSLRNEYISELLPYVRSNLASLVDLPGLDFRYQPGWPEEAGLAATLDARLDSDLRRGFTQAGPHRADLLPLLDGVPAIERISRGQQKQLVSALLLAQAELMMEKNRQPCLFLIDDLPAELDMGHRQRVLERLLALQSQLYITTTDADAIPSSPGMDARMFHVEQGRLAEIR